VEWIPVESGGHIFSKTGSSVRAGKKIDAFEDQYVFAQTGFGASGAASH